MARYFLTQTYPSTNPYSTYGALPTTTGTSFTITSASVSSNLATITTSAAHGFLIGDFVRINNLTTGSGLVDYPVKFVNSTTTFIIDYTASNGTLTLGSSPSATKLNLPAQTATITIAKGRTVLTTIVVPPGEKWSISGMGLKMRVTPDADPNTTESAQVKLVLYEDSGDDITRITGTTSTSITTTIAQPINPSTSLPNTDYRWYDFDFESTTPYVYYNNTGLAQTYYIGLQVLGSGSTSIDISQISTSEVSTTWYTTNWAATNDTMGTTSNPAVNGTAIKTGAGYLNATKEVVLTSIVPTVTQGNLNFSVSYDGSNIGEVTSAQYNYVQDNSATQPATPTTGWTNIPSNPFTINPTNAAANTGLRYWVFLRFINSLGTYVSADDAFLIGPPTGISITATYTAPRSVSITGSATTSGGTAITTWKLEQSKNSGAFTLVGEYPAQADPNNLVFPTYSNTTLDYSTTYQFRLSAKNSLNVYSTVANSASFTTAVQTTNPSAPTNFTATLGSDPTTSINLTWGAPADIGGGASSITNYTLTRTSPSATTLSNSLSFAFTDTGRTPTTPHSYSVTATNNLGLTSPAATVSITTDGGRYRVYNGSSWTQSNKYLAKLPDQTNAKIYVYNPSWNPTGGWVLTQD